MNLKTLDRLLSKIGVIREAKHAEAIAEHRRFTALLGQAAKLAGVKVLLNNENLKGLVLDRDIFVIGSFNQLSDLEIVGGSLVIGPEATGDPFNGIRVTQPGGRS